MANPTQTQTQTQAGSTELRLKKARFKETVPSPAPRSQQLLEVADGVDGIAVSMDPVTRSVWLRHPTSGVTVEVPTGNVKSLHYAM